MKIAAFLALIVAVAGCGAPPPAANNVAAAPSLETDLNAVPAPDRPPQQTENNADGNVAAPEPQPSTNGAMPPFAEVPGAHPNPPVPAPIPAAFRGIWAESRALCADLSHPMRLVVSGRTLRFHESVVEESRVDVAGPRRIRVVGTATGEGETRPAVYRLTLDAAGDRLTVNDAVRVRCG